MGGYGSSWAIHSRLIGWRRGRQRSQGGAPRAEHRTSDMERRTSNARRDGVAKSGKLPLPLLVRDFRLERRNKQPPSCSYLTRASGGT